MSYVQRVTAFEAAIRRVLKDIPPVSSKNTSANGSSIMHELRHGVRCNGSEGNSPSSKAAKKAGGKPHEPRLSHEISRAG
jgi:hypothetical protein